MIADQYQFIGNNGYGWSFYLSSNHLRLSVYHGDGSYTDHATSVTLGEDEWYTVRGIHDPGEDYFELLVWDETDQLELSTWGADDDIASHSAHPLTIGYRADGNGGYNPFHGYIDWVEVMNEN